MSERWPRLGSHVLPRRHVIDGRAAVILFDLHTDEVLQIGAREWELLAAADGTRTLEGIVVAAARQGARAKVEDVRTFFSGLEARGLLVYEPEPERKGPEEPTRPGDRPVRPLPGYRYACDRSGRCCRMYATVLATTEEAERARSVLPERTFGGVTGAGAFLPVRGSVVAGAVAVASCDGACGYLDDDGACSLHREAGPQSKPAGCRLFPVTFIDDGESIHASVKCECACMLVGAGAEGAEPLVDPAIETAADLPPIVVVDRLPETLAVTGALSVSRSEAVAFSRRWLEQPEVGDVARSCWAMADALDDGLEAGLSAWSSAEAAPEVEAVVPWVGAMAARVSTRARVDARWRSARDRVRTVGSWIALTTAACREPEMLAALLEMPPNDAALEALFFRATTWAYELFDEDLGGLQRGLRDLAVRLWVARAMPSLTTEDDDEPLTALQAWLRAYGAWRYIDDVPLKPE